MQNEQALWKNLLNTVYDFHWIYVWKAEVNTRIFPKNIVKDYGSEGDDKTRNGGKRY